MHRPSDSNTNVDIEFKRYIFVLKSFIIAQTECNSDVIFNSFSTYYVICTIGIAACSPFVNVAPVINVHIYLSSVVVFSFR
jgi:hypothetical protein